MGSAESLLFQQCISISNEIPVCKEEKSHNIQGQVTWG